MLLERRYMCALHDDEYLIIVYMYITLSTNVIRNISDTTLFAIAFIGYIIGAAVYYIIKEQFVGKLLTEQVLFFGNLSRVTHVISYMFLGYVFPNRFITIMILGIGWELIEWTLACLKQDPYWGIGQDHANDVIANAVGFLIGYIFYRVSFPTQQ